MRLYKSPLVRPCVRYDCSKIVHSDTIRTHRCPIGLVYMTLYKFSCAALISLRTVSPFLLENGKTIFSLCIHPRPDTTSLVKRVEACHKFQREWTWFLGHNFRTRHWILIILSNLEYWEKITYDDEDFFCLSECN